MASEIMANDPLRSRAIWRAVNDTSFRISADSFRTPAIVSDAFGIGMAQHLHLSSAPMIGIQSPKKVRLAVTRLTSDSALPDRTLPFQRDEFFTVQIYLRPTVGGKLWYGSRAEPVDPRRYDGSVTIHDFDRQPSVYLGSAFDILQFYIPREALDEFCEQNQLSRCGSLSWPHGQVDTEFRQLALSILPAFEHPESSSQLHFDYLILAAHAYIARNYGRVSKLIEPIRGGLAPWQSHRATERLRENLDGNIRLADLARECGLSPSHFAHSFRKTFGQPPHRWLIEQRIRFAQNLLLRSSLPIIDIAHRSGFSDQTAFYRAFKRVTDSSPAQWRAGRKIDKHP